MPVLACPDCDHQFRVADLPPGTPVRCTNCRCQLRVPDRPLRKRTVVEGHIGGRSDYIDAEDFGPAPVKRTRDKAEIQLNNTFTVMLLVGTTGLTIAVILTIGYVIARERGKVGPGWVPAANNAAPADPAPAAPVPDAPPVPPLPDVPPGGAPADAEAGWAKLVGTWEGEREERKDGKMVRVRTRLRFTPERRMIREETTTNVDGSGGGESKLDCGVSEVAADGEYLRVGCGVGPGVTEVTHYRFAADGRLVSAKVPKRGDQAEAQALTYNRVE